MTSATKTHQSRTPSAREKTDAAAAAHSTAWSGWQAAETTARDLRRRVVQLRRQLEEDAGAGADTERTREGRHQLATVTTAVEDAEAHVDQARALAEQTRVEEFRARVELYDELAAAYLTSKAKAIEVETKAAAANDRAPIAVGKTWNDESADRWDRIEVQRREIADLLAGRPAAASTPRRPPLAESFIPMSGAIHAGGDGPAELRREAAEIARRPGRQ